jgi:hypothetical protein
MEITTELAEELPIGEVIDHLYELRTERLALGKKVDDMKRLEAELRSIIISRLKLAELDGGKGKTATASITSDKQARVVNWAEFWDYCVENNASDLVQKRPAILAIKARWDEGEDIPGLTSIEVEDLSLTKRSAR